jgi:hypothetical protein
MRHVPVIQAVKQIVQLPKKSTQRRDGSAVFTHVADLTRCVEHIINALQHRERYVKAVKTEDSIKPIRGSQHMKSGSTKASDWSVA